MSVAGVTSQSPKFGFELPVRAVAEGPEDAFPQLLKKRMDSGYATTRYIFRAAAEMKRRSAEGDLDKIAGLAFNLATGWQHPEFYEERSVEEAWSRFALCMSPRVRGDLFFLFPAAGEGKMKWLPSWRQLLDDAEVLASNSMTVTAELDSDSDFNPSAGAEGEYTCRAIILPSCTLSGFDPKSMAGGSPRHGTITVETDRVVTFRIVAPHDQPMPDGNYALLTNLGKNMYNTCRFWVVGALGDHGERFTKMMVLQMDKAKIDEVELYTALDLSESGQGNDVRNMQSRWIRNLILA